MTNYEAIKAMDEEKLSEFLGGIVSCYGCLGYSGNGDDHEDNKAFFWDWLHEEEQDDDTVVAHSEGRTINISHANVVIID